VDDEPQVTSVRDSRETYPVPARQLDVYPLVASRSFPNLPIAVPLTLDYLYLKQLRAGDCSQALLHL